MAKQGQQPDNPAAPVSEADRWALDHFRHELSEARGELDALKRDAQATVAEVTEALGPIVPLTESARGLSTAIERLEWQLQRFSQQGTPLYLGPPPARSGPGMGLVLVVVCSLVVLGWLLFGPDPAARFSDLDRPALPRRLSPAPPPPASADRVPRPEPADPPLHPAPLPRRLSPPPTPAPAAPVAPPRRDADA